MISRHPGLKSYRGRFAVFSIVIALSLLTIAAVGWFYVEQTSRQQIEQTDIIDHGLFTVEVKPYVVMQIR